MGRLATGAVVNETVRAVVDEARRQAIQRAHTATHLLHHVLRDTLGKETRQEGSFVDEDRLRFDFNCQRPLSREELRKIEESINQRILEHHDVEAFKTTRQEAASIGAIALFGEKYGEEVRVVKIGDFSMELCGGIHLDNSSEVGFLKLVREEPVAAGIRRLEALTGRQAYAFTVQEETVLNGLSSALRTPVQNLEERVLKLIEEKKQLEADICELQSFAAQSLTEELMRKGLKFEGFTLILSKVNLKSVEHLRVLADKIRERVDERLLGVLASSIGGRAKFLTFVSDDLKRSCPASSIAKEIATMVGGGGGGRPTIAEAGGKDPSTIDDTLNRIGVWMQEKIGSQ
jgi:alanyl-tRNA synthetase